MIERTSPRRSDADRSPSERVVERVAAAEGTEPTRLEERLHDSVDPDALDALFARGSATVTIEFEFGGHAVTVVGDEGGSVRVDATE